MIHRPTRHHVTGRVALAVVSIAAVALLADVPADAVATPDWIVTTIAGQGTEAFSGDGGPAALADINEPRDSAVAPDGSLVFVDTFNNRIRRIAPDGTIITIAGTGVQGYNADGIPAVEAQISWPHDITVDTDGTIYFADSNNHRVRRIGLDGIITTVAGTGVPGSTGDGGPATEARIRNPKSVALFGGSLFFTGLDDKVRAIDLATGLIRTVAGTGVTGFGGDGGDALLAQFDTPQRMQIDSTGTIYVADTQNHAIRRITPDGIITTIVGTGMVPGNDGDGGPGALAHLDSPRGIALDGDALLYIADTENHRISVLDLTTGIIDAVAGTVRGYGGDGGPGSGAMFFQPRGLTVLPTGELVVADTLNSRLRLVSRPAPPAPPVASVTVVCDNLTCTADGTASTDPDGSITAWAWDFGDVSGADGPTAVHTYAAAGTYDVTLTVTDTDGLTAEAVQTVTVTAGPLAPVAGWVATCDQLSCNFDASPSSDPDGTLASWAWDFGDGTVGRRKLTSHTYALAGVYTVTLTVTDDSGMTTSFADRVVVDIDISPTNIAPTALFGIDCFDTVCTFDAAFSTDPDGSIVAYQWDLGDGAVSDGQAVTHTYAEFGSYLVSLTVTDDGGATNTLTIPIDVF